MRVLFASYSDKTHFIAMVAQAWALRTAGHEVRVATQPKLVDTVTRTGLTAVSVGRDNQLWRVLEQRAPDRFEAAKGGVAAPYDVAELPVEQITRDYLVEGYAQVVPWWHRMINDPMTVDLVAFARGWQPDLVIWETNTYAGAIAAKACGAVHARLMWSLDYFGRTRDIFLRLKEKQPEDVTDPLAGWLGSQAAKYGAEFSEDMTCGHFTLDYLPPSLRMDANLHYVPMRYVPYNGTAVVPRWLWEPPRRPRVAITLGVSAVQQFGGYAVNVQELLDSLADLDIEFVATLPDEERAKLERIPANIRIVPFVPLHALVPTCSAVIHHTGPGTMLTTALYGVPHLALPKQYDEPFLAARLAEQGAGLALPATKATGPRIREYLLRLLGDESFTAGAAKLQAEMQAMPTPNELVGRLETLVADYAV
jgi:glycosyltransferase (activator-dependent family)